MKPTILLVLFFVCMTTALVAQSAETMISKTWEQGYPIPEGSPLNVKVTVSVEKRLGESTIKVLSQRIELSTGDSSITVVTCRIAPQGGDPNPDVPAYRYTILAVKSELKDSVPAEVRKHRQYIEASGVCLGYNNHLGAEVFIGTPMPSFSWKLFSSEIVNRKAVDSLLVVMEFLLARSMTYANSGNGDANLDRLFKEMTPQLRELVAGGIPALFVEE